MEEPGRQRQGRWKLAGTLRDTARERTGAAGDGEDRTTLWRDFVQRSVWRPEPPSEEEEEITEENVYDRYDESIPFFPDQVLKDGYVSTALLIACVALSYVAPAPLSDPTNTATITYVPQPEWFFFYEQMLMFFPGYALISIGAVVVPTIFIVLLYALPWLDRQPGHAAIRRPFATVVGILVVIVVILNMLLALSRIMNFPGGG
jgi:menaquinol-cytochrome c reductase cytochrome b/c subunit